MVSDARENHCKVTMKIFKTEGSDWKGLEKTINDWLDAEGERIARILRVTHANHGGAKFNARGRARRFSIPREW